MDTTTDEQGLVSFIMGETEETTGDAPVEEQTKPETTEAVEDETPDAEQVEGDEDVAETEESEDSPEPQKFKVKVDGREIEVTLDDLTRDFSGQAYIQKGMKEAADARKQAEATLQSLQAAQQQVLNFAQTLQTQGVRPAPKAPDPKLAETDPIAYTKAFGKFQAESQAYHQQQSQITALQEQYQRNQTAQLSAYVTEQAAILRTAIPEFSDPEIAGKTTRKMRDLAKAEYGYSDTELDAVYDARAMRVLHEALKYREIVARTADAKKQPNTARNVSPGAKRSEPAQLARAKIIERAKKTQSTDDWAAALLTPQK